MGLKTEGLISGKGVGGHITGIKRNVSKRVIAVLIEIRLK